jgi:methyl-accepting chemotaxis protein
MAKLSFKIAYPIIIAGFFIMVSFIALDYNNLSPSFYFVFAFIAVYVFLFGFAIGQNFTAPVKKLLQRADDLSKGDLKSRFYLEGKDELGQLSQVFNKIAEQLEQSNAEKEKTEQSVGIKVEAQTQSLKETINALERKVQNRTSEIQKMVGDLEKIKQYSKGREQEAEELKNQIAELKKKIDGSSPKKAKAPKVKKSENPSSVSIIQPDQEDTGVEEEV